MAGSMLDALKNAKLIKPDDALWIEEQKRADLKAKEQASKKLAEYRASEDQKEAKNRERYLKKAARDTTKAANRVGTKDYYNRFK